MGGSIINALCHDGLAMPVSGGEWHASVSIIIAANWHRGEMAKKSK